MVSLACSSSVSTAVIRPWPRKLQLSEVKKTHRHSTGRKGERHKSIVYLVNLSVGTCSDICKKIEDHLLHCLKYHPLASAGEAAFDQPFTLHNAEVFRTEVFALRAAHVPLSTRHRRWYQVWRRRLAKYLPSSPAIHCCEFDGLTANSELMTTGRREDVTSRRPSQPDIFWNQGGTFAFIMSALRSEDMFEPSAWFAPLMQLRPGSTYWGQKKKSKGTAKNKKIQRLKLQIKQKDWRRKQFLVSYRNSDTHPFHFQQLKYILAKAVALRIILNIGDGPVASRSHTHPVYVTHNNVSRVDPSDLDFGLSSHRHSRISLLFIFLFID